MSTPTGPTTNRWVEAWPDALAFAGGLAVAWYAGWATTDLVWSLWLSSLVVGYTIIVWSIFGPVSQIARGAFAGPGITINGKGLTTAALGGGVLVIGGLLLLGFFTFHFGMFHFVHSVFLASFFPIDGKELHGMPGPGYYLEVFRRYWLFLPLAFLAERQAFRPPAAPPGPPDTAVTAEAIAARKARNAAAGGLGSGMMEPYKNVMHMHLLIFFFAIAHFAKLENFLVYAVVYAVYFFPWRLLKRDKV